MNLNISLRCQGVQSFAALIREGVETLASLVRGDEFVLTNARSACLNASTP